MAFCLPPEDAKKLKDAILTGKLDIQALMNVDTGTRRAEFSKVVGDNLAEGLNTAYESKLLLKDQQNGMLTWLRQSTMTKQQRAGYIEKVNKLQSALTPAQEKDFYADFMAKQLGHGVTFAEAKVIADGADNVQKLKQKYDPATGQWASEADRMAYGTARVVYQDYVGGLMKDANVKTFREWITQPNGKAILDIANATKGIVASLDNSFFGRQGIKTLYTRPGVWMDAFGKSWGDIATTLAGGDPMLALRADIASRPNAMNGKYANGKFALGLEFEEAFPTALPERIPLFGRLYKASEKAFTGGALRLRSSIADSVIAQAEGAGIDFSTPNKQAEAIGHYVNSLTGRGNIGRVSGEWVNASLFSIRYFKSNWDTLTLHTGGFGIEAGPARDFVRKQAAINLLKIAGAVALQYTIASILWPGSVDADPRSANFGKIKIGNTRFDITGGMGSIISLASRIAPTMHNGRLSHWSKSATTGKWTDLSAGKFGQRTQLDMVEDFAEGKASPFLGSILDSLRGTDFTGNKISYSDKLVSLVKPMPINTMQEAMKDPKAAPVVLVMILDGLGIGASTYGAHQPKRAPKEIWQPGYFGQ